MKHYHDVQLCMCCIGGCTVHTSRRLAGRFVSRHSKPVLTLIKITSRQGLKNADNSNCSSSTGFRPTLKMMTKLFARWPAILTKLSADFSATVCRTSNLFSGQLRDLILRRPQTVVLFAVSFVDCEEWLCILVVFLPSAHRVIVCILFSLEQSPLSAFAVRTQCFEF